MIAEVGTAAGVVLVDLEEETVVRVDPGARVEPPAPPRLSLPLRVVAAAASGSTVVAVVETRPPLLVSHDAGVTWRESGRGLPPGRAVAVAQANPDVVVYGARNRLYVSTDGARFWRAVAVELPEIEALALDG